MIRRIRTNRTWPRSSTPKRGVFLPQTLLFHTSAMKRPIPATTLQTKFKNYTWRFLNVSTNFQYKKKPSTFVNLSCKMTYYKYNLFLAFCRTILITHTNLPKFDRLIGIFFFTYHAFYFYYYFVWLSYNIHNNY